MLLEFRVGNFRSIRDIQTLSLVATTDKSHQESHVEETGISSTSNALKSAVIYGANASGKTSVLMALDYMRAVVAESASTIQPGQTYNVQRFKLDETFEGKPTLFEVNFLREGVRYEYSFQMTQARFLKESLNMYRTARPTLIFSREFDGDKDVYEFGTYLTGPKKIWEESTRSNALFLSTAAQLNSEILSPVFKWLTFNLVFLPAQAIINTAFSTALLGTKEGQESVKSFMAAADISIDEISTIERKEKGFTFQFNPNAAPHTTQEEREFKMPVFKHISPKGSATFDLGEESTGTQRLFALAAPVLDVLRDGRILLVDELDASLHPLLVRQLIEMFHSKKINKNKAQLIFSTHDTSLLDQSIFRRDQVWFTEKDSDQATNLYPLTDFSPRKNEALEKGYLVGRYGAIPFFRDFKSLLIDDQKDVADQAG
ncbi:MAG: ATP-binding protein [Betaproteobacteria bacterium]|nr:ATP-binding protein [Betaproteobacteria bacterium]MDE2056594.1 ATP-binding protein [Betaproteobacteria bacterium]